MSPISQLRRAAKWPVFAVASAPNPVQTFDQNASLSTKNWETSENQGDVSGRLFNDRKNKHQKVDDKNVMKGQMSLRNCT